MTEREPTRFEHYKKRAGQLVSDRERIRDLAQDAGEKLERTGGWSARFRAVREDLRLLISLLQAYYRGEYTDVSKRTLVTIAAGVLYFLMPLDVIPDFLLGLGLADDAAVIGYVIAAVRGEIDAYRTYLAGKENDQP